MLPRYVKGDLATSASVNNAETTADLSGKQLASWNWKDHFGHPVDKDHMIWSIYVQAATVYDKEVILTLIHGLDVLLTFSALFSAIVTAFIIQNESGLSKWDIPSHNVKILVELYKIFQDPVLHKEDLITYEEEDQYNLRVSIILWYLSLYISILVAGGAVYSRQWLLGYKRSNASESDRAPYHRVIHHQQCLVNLDRFFVAEFGDLLGSVVIIDVMIFIAGCHYHTTPWRTGDGVLQNMTASMFLVFLLFMVLTVIISLMVPHSPYHAGITNFLKKFPSKVLNKMLRDTVTDFWYALGVSIVAAIILSAVCVVWGITAGFDLWLIPLWLAPMILSIVCGLRIGLKRGRISHYVPLMGIALGALAGVSMFSILMPTHLVGVHRFWRGAIVIVSYVVMFVIVIGVLALRFANAKGRASFPLVSCITTAVGVLAAVLISGRHTYWWFQDINPNEDDPSPGDHVKLLISMGLIWASMLLLSITALLQEDAVEEDTIEAEALGWLITQLGDTEKLQIALACIPSIGNTPLRREKILERASRTLASLIHSLVVPPQQRHVLIGKGSSRSTKDGRGSHCSMDHEAQLQFYISCLAELSQVMPMQVGSSFKGWWNRWVRRIRRCWIYNNWYRIFGQPSRESFVRELHFYHHWYPWPPEFTPDMLQTDLQTLITHPNSYIRTISQAALLQLYPLTCSPMELSSWPVLCRASKTESDFFNRLQMLAELRMVTMRVIHMYRGYRAVPSSILRYLYRYCDNALNLWMRMREDESDEKFFEAAMVLCYLILENHSDIPLVTTSGDSVPMKVARCITALKRWSDSNHNTNERQHRMIPDLKFCDSFAHSIVAASLKYIKLAAKAIESDSYLNQKDEGVMVDEDSINTGLACLERSLRRLTSEQWPETLWNDVDKLVSTLETLHSINIDATLGLFPLDTQWDPTPLLKHLKNRAAKAESPIFTVEDKASAIRTACKLLNEVSNPSDSWALAVEEPSIPEVVGSFTQQRSIIWHIFALSTVLNTYILCPTTARSHETYGSSNGEELSSTSKEARIDTLPYHKDLVKLYKQILEDPSQLYQSMSEPKTQLNEDLIEKTISFIVALVDSLPHTSLLSNLLERQYLRPVALIASHSDDTLVSTLTRQRAIYILGQLWASRHEKTNQSNDYEDAWDPKEVAEAVAKGVTILVECLGNIDTTYVRISSWIDLLNKVSQDPPHADMLKQTGLVEVLLEAVAWTDTEKLGESVPGDLESLKDKLKGHSNLVESQDLGLPDLGK
ncbi:hypothetical protein FRC02_006928 [Tulasnella sp. 418]|nr:hypothetical protein FRC02_006928 [Tulasnella sp. 418]